MEDTKKELETISPTEKALQEEPSTSEADTIEAKPPVEAEPPVEAQPPVKAQPPTEEEAPKTDAEQSPADVDKMLKAIYDQGKKIIITEALAPNLTTKQNTLINELLTFKKKIEEEQNTILKENDQVESQLENLKKNNGLRIDLSDKAKTEFSIHLAQYKASIGIILQEIDQQVAYCKHLLSLKPESLLAVDQNAPNDFPGYVSYRIRGTKQFMKNLKKNLTVKHSQFSFRFEQQKKHLEYIEQVVQAHKHKSH